MTKKNPRLPTLHLNFSATLSLESAMLGLGLGLVVFGILLTTVFMLSYRNKFYPGVLVDNIQVGGLTREEAYTLLQQHQPQVDSAITLTVDEISIASSSAELNLHKDYNTSLHEAFKVGRDGFLFGRIMKIWNIQNQTYQYTTPHAFDSKPVKNLVNILKSRVDIPGKEPSASLRYSQSPSSLSIDKGFVGRELMVEETVKNILARASDQEVNLTAQTTSVGTQLNPLQIEDARQRALKFVTKLAEYQADDKVVRLYDTDLIELLTFPTGISNNILEEKINSWQEIIDRPPQDAVFEYDKKTLVVKTFKPHRNGLKLDTDKTEEQIKNFIWLIDNQKEDESAQDNYRYSLTVKEAEPDAPLSKTNDLGITERIGFGDSLYDHSIPSRIHNVAITTAKLNNTIVAPGQEFSFNKTIGDISSKTGYKPAWVIKGGQTVLGDGGGVCQVSTTTFRAILDAGLNITKRLPHSYRVSYYELNQKPGIDATVYSGNIDLRFINDTDHHVLITGETDSENLYMKIEIWGTSDGRTTAITNHKTWGYSPPLPTVYIPDPNLPTGVKKQVDWAVSGIKASFKHTIYDKDGNVTDEDVYSSSYRPWSAKYLVGM